MSVYEAVYKLITTLPAANGELLPEVRKAIRASAGQNRQVLLAYPPKVGGTFMRTALVHLLNENYGAYLSRGSYADSDHARDLYFPTILNQMVVKAPQPQAAVMHLHLFPARHVTDMIEAFDIPVVIATRDILDTLISGIDMAKGTENAGFAFDDAILSNGKPYTEMTESERRYSVVHYASLWYARFYAQWLRYDRECRDLGKRPPLWLTYAELKEEPQAVLARMARHVDPIHQYSADQVSRALAISLTDKSAIRYNKAISGRGSAYFTADEQAIIYRTLSAGGIGDLVRLGVLPSTVHGIMMDQVRMA